MVDLREERLQHIKQNPSAHRHRNLDALANCCTVNGAVDVSLLDAHERFAPVGRNGGRNCDVLEGPCSCGVWH